MSALVRLIMLLAAVVTTMACLPVTEIQQTNAPPQTATSGPALSALKPVTPIPPSPSSEISDSEFYPMLPGTPSLPPYPDDPYLGELETTPQLSEFDIFMETRAAELNVPELQGDLRVEAVQLFEGTQEAANWQNLDEETLQYLALFWEPIVQLQPGETHGFEVGLLITTFYTFPSIEIQKSWHISPTVGATIDPDTGFFTVEKNTPPGSVYTVTADMENGRATSIDVYVYTPEESPLVGHWREEKQVSCTDDEEITPVEAMDQLVFFADGTFTAAWPFFEGYHKDYWGTYDYDLATGELLLNVEDSTYMPSDFDGSGYAVVDGGSRLVLENIWLGKPESGQGSTNCGHIFIRDLR